MERHFQGRWNVNIVADKCWLLQRDTEKNTDENQAYNNALRMRIRWAGYMTTIGLPS